MKRTAIVCAALLGCSGSTGGQSGFEVELSFAADALPAPGVPLSWRMTVEWPGGSAQNVGEEYGTTPLTVTAVPDGPDRRVLVELYDTNDHVYYYGESEPFDLDDDSRRVAVVLVSTPEGSFSVLGAAGPGEDAGDVTHTRTVDLHIFAAAGTRIRVDHNPTGIVEHGTERALTDLEAVANGFRWHNWELDVETCCDASASDPSACVPPSSCPQSTTVYAVLLDEHDYPSTVLEATVEYDNRNWSCPEGVTGSSVCAPTCGDLTLEPCARVLLVDTASTASDTDGVTWTTAYSDLQTALGAAVPGDEIWVAAGLYPPDVGPLATNEDHESTFQLKESVEMYGCFAGGESARDQRDCEQYETVLWGDLDGEPSINASSAYHVVRAGAVSEATVLDGFTIRNGHADGAGEDARGGGMYIRGGTPTLRNCIFRDNAANQGGGLFVNDGNPNIIDVTFEDNRALYSGGGVAVSGLDAPTFESCTFARNRVSGVPGPDDTWGGAGLYVTRSQNLNASAARVQRCQFFENEATNAPGGAIYNVASFADAPTTTVVSTLFSGNRSVNGGAVYNRGTAVVELINVTMAFNCSNWYRNDAVFPDPIEECLFDTSAEGTVFNVDAEGTATLVNGILWSNGPTELVGTIAATYSCVAGGAIGEGNIDCDPAFVDADGADDIPGNDDDDVHLSAGSAGIDAGDARQLPADATLDLDGEARFVDDPGTADTGIGAGPVIDMGAYEYH